MLRSAYPRAKTLISFSGTLASSSSVNRPLFFCTQSRSSSIVRDLTATHGFPRETAETIASLIEPQWRRNYPSVLALFCSYGFGHSDVSSIVIRQPYLLNANADKTLKPKLDAFACHGVEGPILVQVITGDPFILGLSASVRLLPCLQCLSGFFGSTQRLVDLLLLRRGTWVFHKFTPAMEGNIDTLRQNRVPDTNIVRLMLIRPRTLCRDLTEFRRIVEEIQELGMDAKSSMFIYGVVTRAGMKKDKWVSKVDVFKQFGWTERELRQLFVKQPKVMDPSGETLGKSLEYYLNQLGWTREDIMTYPSLLFASLQNRVIPRMSVLNALVSDGLMKKKGVPQALLLTNESFVAKYVAKYKDRRKHLSETL